MLEADPNSLLEALGSLLSSVDVAVLTGDFVTDVINNIFEGIKDRRDGWVDDDLAFIESWGFDLGQIETPVMLLHGKQDLFVPFSHGEWLANNIPDVGVDILPDDGHITLVVSRISEVFAWLLRLSPSKAA